MNQTVLPTLAAETYNGIVTITPTSGSTIPATVSVTLTVSPTPPVTFSPATINLAYQIGEASPAQQTLTLSTTGTQGVPFSLATAVDRSPAGNAVWFTVSPSGGGTIPANGSTPITVSYNGGLQPGPYTGHITVTSRERRRNKPFR